MILKFLLLITVITYVGASASDINQPITQKIFFYGTIDKQPIRMILDRNNTTLNGFYYTPEGVASVVDINISGTVSENGILSLKNVNNMLFIGQWKQKPNKTIIIDGIIEASKTAKKKNFHFEQEPIFLDHNQKISTRELFEDYITGKIHQEISLRYPEFKDTSLDGQQVINKEFYKFIDPELESGKEWNRKWNNESSKYFTSPTTATFLINYQINYFDNNYLSIVYDGYLFAAGSANGYDFFKTLTINVLTGEIMNLQDFFYDESYLKVISRYVREKLISKYALEDESYLKNSAPNEDNFNIWALAPTGVEIYFNRSSIGAGAEGKKHIIIPYKEFGNNFKLQLEGAGLINRKSVDTIDKYNSKVQKIIFSNFHPDSGTEGFSARIRLTLTADGKLTSYRVMSYSENAALNAEVDSLKNQLRDESFPKNPNGEEAVFEIILTAKD